MASSWLLSIASMAFAFVTPIDKMSKTRPLDSLFHPAVFMSMLGQAAIHLGCMVYAVQLATEAMGPVALKEVVDFHKHQKMIRMGHGDDRHALLAELVEHCDMARGDIA